MIIRGETTEQFWDRVCSWHSAFAWLPVRMECGNLLWLERIDRRSTVRGPTRLDIVWEARKLSDQLSQ